jgi:hypothetical protein
MNPVEQYVTANWKRKTVKMMVQESGYSDGSIRKACAELGIDPISERELKEKIVLSNCDTMTAADILRNFGIAFRVIQEICEKWGVKCVPSYGPGRRVADNPKTDLSKMTFSQRLRFWEVKEWKAEHIKDGPVELDWDDE